jgi:hypothetical protein
MTYNIYCDESRQTKDRFMVLGGLIIEQSDVPKFDSTMKKFRVEQKMHAELKWTKVSRGKLREYEGFIDYFFALNSSDKVHFHSIILDNHAINHAKFSQGQKEIGFYKFYYQLLLNCFGKAYCRLGTDDRFVVHLDQRETKYSLQEFKKILNNGMAKKFDNHTEPFRSVEPRNSKDVDLIQIADLLIGAIGFQKNGYSLVESSNAAKVSLANYIAKKAGLTTLVNNTPYRQARFKIWNFKLQK